MVGTYTGGLTTLARRAARPVSRSPSPTRSRAWNTAIVSPSDTRTPLRRSSAVNSTTLASIGSLLVQDVLVACRPLQPGALELEVLLQLLLCLADVALVLEDHRQRVRHQLVLERVDVEQ